MIAPLTDEHTVAEVLAGRYELLGLVGTGGMGSVYRARDLELDEVVALKVLRRELVNTPEMLARFRQEVKLARRVTHPNVARTFDIGEHHGEKFLTMEFIDGISLAEMLYQDPQREELFPLARVVDIGLAICAGLDAAHRAGVVHRDLKPDNVLVTKDDRVAITDFGIARAVLSAHVTVGAPVGTPAYMSPEQVEGLPVDERADVYALGEILYELLTGVTAWSGESIFQVAAQRLLRPPPDPRAQRSTVPDGAAQIVMRCMARKPEDRYASASEIAAALSTLTLPVVSQVRPNAKPAAPTRPSLPLLETPPGDKKVAVLPFQNGGRPEDDYLASGLTEDLIDTLSVMDGIRVRPLGAAINARTRSADSREVGRELGVQVVVEGSLRRTSGGLRVSARIVSVGDGFQLWASRFERPEADFLKVGDEIACAISRALIVERPEVQQKTIEDPIAYDLYLRARHELHRYSPETTQRAIELYQEALARTPDDPVILSGYALARLKEFMYSDGNVSGDATRLAAERAMSLAPNLPEAHLASGCVAFVFGESERGAREIREALRTGKRLADAHEMFGRLAIEVDRIEAGIEHLGAALSIEPRLLLTRGEMARGYELLGNPQIADELLAVPPTDPQTYGVYWLQRARIIYWRRDLAAARTALSLEGPLAPVDPGRMILDSMLDPSVLARQLAFLDQRANVGGQALRRTAMFRQIKAEVLSYHGDEDGALAATLEAERAGLFDIGWCMRCPIIEALRRRKEFQELTFRVGERAAKIRSALGLT
ncbi:protein kinase domain-containing protein [Pendulispora albinea]|uniref:Protein kinase n=1 Tax=Pendulispora albinea TaxID=2741071 RepID=A0ABZ2M3A6_9BACT